MGKWTAKEDVNLTNAVRTHGKNWQAIAPLIPGRTNDQCRKRWAWMNPFERKTEQAEGEFTAQEDATLKTLR
jgi:hypothetical protein